MKYFLSSVLIFLIFMPAATAEGYTGTEPLYDTVAGGKYIHAVSWKLNMGAVNYGTPRFAEGRAAGKLVEKMLSAHLKYDFRSKPGTWNDVVYGSPYQGLGIAFNTFFNTREVGNPATLYIFQGAKIAQVSPRLSLNYEWDFGISAGWKPFDANSNRFNQTIGSKVNAYLNVGIIFSYALGRHVDIEAGIAGTHFSNGNTKTPNHGVNAITADLGMKYNFGRKQAEYLEIHDLHIPGYRKHFEHEFLFYGSWRQTTVDTDGTSIEIPYLDQKFAVAGASYTALYALSYKVRLGAGIDAHYDQGAGVTYNDVRGEVSLIDTRTKNKLFGGTFVRADYVMPYFTLAFSLGYDFIHYYTNYKPFYQSLSLKIDVANDIFVNIGYRLSSFKNPNFLMLGGGFRLNGKK